MALNGKWITNGTASCFYARKRFTLGSVPAAAAARICGLGQFQAFLNGKKIGDHVLDPAWTDYRKYISYVEFDLTGLLSEGENVIAVEVGNGWFHMDEDHYIFHFPPFMPPNPNPYRPFAPVLMMNLEIEILFEDGTRQQILSDDSFKTAPHMIRHSNIFGSETLDGSRRIEGWADISLNDEAWENARYVQEDDIPKGQLLPQQNPPVRVIRTYEGKYLHTDAGGRLIYDFGQNMSGMLEFDVIGKKGDIIRAYPAEKLDAGGAVDQMAKNWLPIDVVETYVIGQDDTWEHFAMTFTYFGGRYAAYEKIPATAGQTGTALDLTQIKNVKANAISSADRRSGTFSCDNEKYLQIYDLIEKAVEANFLSVHTDCPTIERFAWQEENVLMTPAIMFMKDIRLHMAKFLTDTRMAQHTAEDYFLDMEGGRFYPGDGLIPSQAPCYMPNVLPVPGMGSFYDTIAWGSSIILGTRWHYLFYGDLSIVRENYEAGSRYLSYLKTRINEDGFINHGLGDWGNPDGEYARENIETAFLYADAVTMAWFAQLLGETSQKREFSALAESVRENYNQRLLVQDADGRWYYRNFSHPEADVRTQACQALPLYWNMVPEDKVKDVVYALRRLVEERGSFVSGEVGLPYIIQSMSEYGMNDLISRCMMKEEHPSYYAFVLDGETTLGEYWEQNPRSHCHDMMGHIAEWYYTGIGGIRILEPGFRKVSIHPWMPDDMNSFCCTYETPLGMIRIAGERGTDGIPNFDIQVPEGITLE